MQDMMFGWGTCVGTLMGLIIPKFRPAAPLFGSLGKTVIIYKDEVTQFPACNIFCLALIKWPNSICRRWLNLLCLRRVNSRSHILAIAKELPLDSFSFLRIHLGHKRKYVNFSLATQLF